MTPAYDIDRSYEENYQEGPWVSGLPPVMPCVVPSQSFLGYTVNSCVGIPAGPLLNARWILAYARMGFDLLVYKTVRTQACLSHPPPNCVFLDVARPLETTELDRPLRVAAQAPQSIEQVSITNSFGMPSRDPALWQADVALAKAGLTAGKMLIVSVVGTSGKENCVDALVEDYSRVAEMAVDAGAHAVELNLSCPNVITKEGGVFCDPGLSSVISKAARKVVGSVPLIIKIGYIDSPLRLEQVVVANAPYVHAISSINTLSFEVLSQTGAQALPGRTQSGVCGAAIRTVAMKQTRQIVALVQKHKYDCAVVGVGGVMTPRHILEYFDTGADAVMSATGAMWDPLLCHKYKESRLSARSNTPKTEILFRP